MGNRCPDCQKFVGLEAVEPEVNSVEVLSVEDIDQETGSQMIEVGGDVHLALNCAECGSEMKTADLTIENESVEFTHNKIRPEAVEGGPEVTEEADDVMCDAEESDLEIEDEGAESTEDYRPPGRPARYQKHFYGAEVSVKIHCSKCEAEDTFQVKVEEQASAFEESY